MVFLHLGLRSEKFKSSVKIAFGPVFRQAAHQFVGKFGVVCDRAAIEVHSQRHVALVGQLRGLFLHPFVESPIFVDNDDGGKRSLPRRCVEHALYGLAAALVRNVLALGSERGEGENNDE